jgi:hypothetical protein
MINTELEEIVKIFGMLNRPESDWDMSIPRKWRYKFTHAQAEPLMELRSALRNGGYSFEELDKVDENHLLMKSSDGKDHWVEPDRTGDAGWMLQMSKDETHSIESLHQRNQELKALATELNIREYWGWSVEDVRNVNGLVERRTIQ